MINIIEQKIQENIQYEVLDIVNESNQHSGPATDSHFKVTIVSSEFEGVGLVKRHQRVYQILSEQLAGPIHALAIHAYTPEQWKLKAQAPSSPNCMGGSKED